MPGWINLDSARLPGIDIIADLEQCAEIPLPIADNSIDEILMSHVIEHIRAPLPLMQELHRIARPRAKTIIRVPYGSSDDAWEDPTHVRAYFLQSFGYFSQPYYWRADYGYRGDWQPMEITLKLNKKRFASMSQPAMLAVVNQERNVVSEMIGVLEAVKPPRQPRRELQTLPTIRIALV
ncbi:MAG: methyltransferase domain-containing protein [Desulfobulbaceae bacterium]|jgi:SAM-dependent methyltransferase|nr:methyltransferase domain-containing protein [Desulfobulbaceae bacterium]